MTFGLDFSKLLVIGVLALFLVGPERLPKYAEGLARLLKRGGEVMRGAKERATEELSGAIGEEDWRRLDPRQYDPRRIIGEALLGDSAALATASAPQAVAERPVHRIQRLEAAAVPPFDSEAT